ncbi:ankyrin repeat domain-containing protein [Amycolatopsis circi]|uniref:ankyrin repeat domain-containing protein n=1 Tax=Amycolatopsis circi TaxID=871959 RepID=UPI000E2804CD|nr:ankyrin repeat domain-containing protein [Amycolatopsis circi]
MNSDGGWQGFDWESWTDLGEVRARLKEGADPNVGDLWPGPPLHAAAEFGSPEVVAELARRVDDVDAMSAGCTALWRAVAAHQPENARALVAAGADPLLDMMSGWSPGRLSRTSPTPELPGVAASLTPEEIVTVEESRRLISVLGDQHLDGLGIACVAGIDVAEAVRRLSAAVLPDQEELQAEWDEDPFNDGNTILTMWATDVPGGCVLAQPWGYGPQMPEVTKTLSVGTTCYGMYANPKSGNQGSIVRDDEMIGWDLHPGGGPSEQGDVLLSSLYEGEALAYCFAYAGLRPVDSRSVTGPPDAWILLPDRDYW